MRRYFFKKGDDLILRFGNGGSIFAAPKRGNVKKENKTAEAKALVSNKKFIDRLASERFYR